MKKRHWSIKIILPLLAFVVACTALFLPAIMLNAATPITDHPQYITNNFGTNATTDLVVQWHNATTIPTQKIQLTTPDDPTFTHPLIEHTVTGQQYFGQTFTGTFGSYGDFAARNIYRVAINNLTPNTTYLYRVGDATNGWSTTYQHRTADGGNDFSFTVATDPQSAAHTAMADTFRAANAFDDDNRFFVLCGDLTNEIETAEIEDYTNVASQFNTTQIIATTQGNHDTYLYEDNFQNAYQFNNARTFNRFTTFPENGYQNQTPDASQSYYFYYNNVLIIMLNSMVASDVTGHQSQVAWLEQVLAADAAEQRSQYIIVCTHVGPFGGQTDTRWPSEVIRQAYMPLFSKYAVDAVFSGHDHVYGRSNPLYVPADTNTDQLNNANFLTTLDFNGHEQGTVYSIVGATGPKFYDASAGQQAQYFRGKFCANQSAIQPGMFVNVKVSAEQLTVTAKVTGSAHGTTLDTYTIPAKRAPVNATNTARITVQDIGVNTATLSITDRFHTIQDVRVYCGTRAFSTTGTFDHLTITDLRARSTYDLTVVVSYANDWHAEPVALTIQTSGVLRRIQKSIMIANLPTDADQIKLYRNGELFDERAAGASYFVANDLVPNGQYLYTIEVYNQAQQIIAVDHTFLVG